jgi:hypothetical protein
MVVTYLHPFIPGEMMTQCEVPGCWGWIDDPRHTERLPGVTIRPGTLRPGAKFAPRYGAEVRLTAMRRRGGPVAVLLPDTYYAARGPNTIDQKCPQCKAKPGRRCWDMRSALLYPNAWGDRYGKTRLRPHRARRVRQVARTEEKSDAVR